MHPIESVAKDSKAEVVHIVFNADVDSTSVPGAIAAIDAAQEAKAIVIEINTDGGSVSDGFQLARTIERSAVPVYCVADMKALSMGFYLLQSCQKRYMTKRAVLMWHEPRMAAAPPVGVTRGYENYASRMRAMTTAMVEHVASRLKLKPGVAGAKVTNGGEWWISWEEALEVGAVDGIVANAETLVRSLE
jgi:ATP-dependent Clp protease protease subunit